MTLNLMHIAFHGVGGIRPWDLQADATVSQIRPPGGSVYSFVKKNDLEE